MKSNMTEYDKNFIQEQAEKFVDSIHDNLFILSDEHYQEIIEYFFEKLKRHK